MCTFDALTQQQRQGKRSSDDSAPLSQMEFTLAKSYLLCLLLFAANPTKEMRSQWQQEAKEK
jgi:hypothetical protein